MTGNSTVNSTDGARNVRNDANPAHEVHVTDDVKKSEQRIRVVVADDEASSRNGLAMLLRDEGFDVILAEDGVSGLAKVQETAPEVLVTDLRMPGMDGIELLRRARELDPEIVVVLMTAFAEVETAVKAMHEGAEHYLTKPLQIDELVLVIRRALERRTLKQEATELRARLKERLKFDAIIGSSPVMQEIFNVIEQVAPSKASVLITGESGTGKELVAQAIHEHSPRSAHPFVKLHCAALAETILESELFGHEKGSFTGAAGRREGRFKQADGGTLFLDEIGEMDITIQARLLKALEEKRFRRVGGVRDLNANFRLIVATNRDLSEEVSSGRFRADLYYRLNVVRIRMPPLRERLEDIPILVEVILRPLAKEMGRPIPTISARATKKLQSYHWPGNVRELRNVLERSLLTLDGKEIRSEDLLLEADSPAGKPSSAALPGSEWDIRPLDEVIADYVAAAVDAAGGNMRKAARQLQISPSTLYARLKERSSEKRTPDRV